MRIVSTGAALILAACGPSPDASEVAPDQSAGVIESQPPQDAADAGTTIRKVSDAELATALGSECPKVTKSEYKGKTDSEVFYAVQCGSNETLLGIGFDGSTKGVPCSLAEQLQTPCWKPWEKGG